MFRAHELGRVAPLVHVPDALEPARRRKLLDEAHHTSMRDDLETIAKMLSGLINGLGKRRT